jgi:hypothetical protein
MATTPLREWMSDEIAFRVGLAADENLGRRSNLDARIHLPSSVVQSLKRPSRWRVTIKVALVL